MKTLALTVDVERFYQGAEEGTFQFLRLLDEFGVKATFFVTNDILQNRPDIVEAIKNSVHEIGSHGFTHRGMADRYTLPILNKLDATQTRAELRMSRNCFKEKEIQVKGYRAPGFLIKKWQIELVGEYFEYDSSVANSFIKTEKYLNVGSKLSCIGHTLEMPVSTLRHIPLQIGTPVFLRFGGELLCWFLRMLPPEDPVIFHFHCFDFVELDKKWLPVSLWKKKYYYCLGNRKSLPFFRRLLLYLKSQECVFKSMSELADDHKDLGRS